MSYKGYLEQAALSSSPSDVILNSSKDQAVLVLTCMFSIAKRKVNLLTGFLNPIVYGERELIDAAVSFLTRNSESTLQILHEEEVDCNKNVFLNCIWQAGLGEQVEVVRIPKNMFISIDSHFCVVDALHYRLEPNRDSYDASIRFNDSILAPKLAEIFEVIYTASFEPAHYGEEAYGTRTERSAA